MKFIAAAGFLSDRSEATRFCGTDEPSTPSPPDNYPMSFAFFIPPPDMYNTVYRPESQNHSFARQEVEDVLEKLKGNLALGFGIDYSLQYFEPSSTPISR